MEAILLCLVRGWGVYFLTGDEGLKYPAQVGSDRMQFETLTHPWLARLEPGQLVHPLYYSSTFSDGRGRDSNPLV
jgi:hypothetical protein